MQLTTKFSVGETFYTCIYDGAMECYQVKPNTIKKIEITHNESQQNVISYVPTGIEGVTQPSVNELNALTWEEAKAELDILNAN